MNTKSKYIIGIIVIIVLIAGAVLATGSASSSHIDVVGSTSVQPVAEKLVEVYKESHPDADITVQGGGSSVGIKNANDGTADIGMSSKDVDQKDGPNLVKHELGQDGIVMAVNPSNPVSDLTTEQLQGIFSGEITNWNEVGGADAPVVPIGREAGSGTRDGFESITGTEDICKYSQELTSTGAVITAVSQNPGAIGYASLASNLDSVKTVTVEGVAPSEDTVKSGEYKIQRPFVFATLAETPLSEAAQAFFDYCTSTDAASIIAGAGAVPVAE